MTIFKNNHYFISIYQNNCSCEKVLATIPPISPDITINKMLRNACPSYSATGVQNQWNKQFVDMWSNNYSIVVIIRFFRHFMSALHIALDP
jgi:hypothetical protein